VILPGSVEGFSVFKSSNPTSEIEQNDIADDESPEKEVSRQLEVPTSFNDCTIAS